MILFILLIISTFASKAIALPDETVEIITMKCLKSKSYDYLITLVYDYDGLDLDGVNNVQNAKSAGIKYVDIVIRPAPVIITNPQSVVDDVIKACPDNKMVWVQAFYFTIDDPVLYLNELIRGFAHANRSVGIMTDEYSWEEAFKNSSDFKSYPLMYIGNDNDSFDDFIPFGGWTKPAMKAQNDITICDLDVCLVYY